MKPSSTALGLFAFFFIIPALADIEGLRTEGTTIKWDDVGWMQVQSVPGYTTVCEGQISECAVEPGDYNIINHSTGDRSDAYRVTGSPVGGGELSIVQRSTRCDNADILGAPLCGDGTNGCGPPATVGASCSLQCAVGQIMSVACVASDPSSGTLPVETRFNGNGGHCQTSWNASSRAGQVTNLQITVSCLVQ